MTPKDLTNW